MANVFDFLVDILKINQQLVNEYASQGPFYQIFYLFLFPAIFIIIFIWILSNRIMGEHKGLRILLAAGVYAFIVLQGYYSWFVMLSKFWFFGLIILGFLYFITYRGGGRGKGAQGMTSAGGKGVIGGLLNQINPFGEYQMQANLLAEKIVLISRQVKEGLSTGRSAEFQNLVVSAENDLTALTKMVPGGKENPGIKKLRKNLALAEKGQRTDYEK